MSDLNTNLTRLADARDDIAEAIVAKGGTVGSLDGFEDFPDDINSIPTGGSSSFTLDNVNCKPSLKGEYSDFPIWVSTDITNNNGSTSYQYVYGRYIWFDYDNNCYHSETSSYFYKYEESLNAWVVRPNSIANTPNYGDNVWTDGDNIYYSYYYSSSAGGSQIHYILNKQTNSWNTTAFTNAFSNFYGKYVWSDGTNIYYSYNKNNLIYNKSTNSWSTIYYSGVNNPSGDQIVVIDNIVYLFFTVGGSYYLDGTTWRTKTWASGATLNGGEYIWFDGDNIYYSNGTTHYVYNKSISDWETKTWNGLTNFSGLNVVNINGTIYFFNGSKSTWYRLNRETDTWVSVTDIQYIIGDNNAMSGNDIWYDGINIYYSNNSIQQVFDKINNIFWNIQWTGLTSFYGRYIWSDGDNIYYSSGTTHYVLDKTNRSWSSKTWYGLASYASTNFNPSYIWSDGENIYYSQSSYQYILNKATSTWESKTWTGLTSFNGDMIWSDGENLIYSNGSTHYKLDIDNSNWISVTFPISFSGSTVRTDGEYIYIGTNIYNKSNNTVTSISSLITEPMWTDGENIYYCNSSGTSSTSTKVLKLTKNKNPITISNPTTPNNRIPFNE